MGKTAVIQTNFTSGEWSPRVNARVDVAKFANSARELFNAIPMVHGGAKRRGGTRYLGEIKDSSKIARLVPFIYSRTQAYAVEFGDLYARFWTPAGQVISGTPVEVASPYLEAELPEVRYSQSEDTLFLAHESYYPRRLQRFTNTVWKLGTIPFRTEPAEEIGDKPATTLTLSAVSGVGITATAGAASFEAADVGRQIIVGAGVATITAYTSTTQVTATVVDTFASVGPHASGAWILTESPKTALTPSVKEPVGAAITLTASAAAFKNNAQVSDIGKFVDINDGLVQITGFTSSTIVTGIIRTILASTTAASSGAWGLLSKVWSADNGYPRAVAFFDQRLVYGGSTRFPATLWGSYVGDYLNMAGGTADDEGFAFKIASDQVATILHIGSTRFLSVLTLGGEYTVQGGTDKPLSPTNVQIKNHTVYGCSGARPLRIGSEVVFVSRQERKIHAFGYRAEEDAFKAPEISILSEHITDPSITEMAYALEPDKVAWMVRGDGDLVTMTFDREQDVVAFGHSATDGIVESVCTIPGTTRDEVFFIVQRTINGATKRYVEIYDEDRFTDCSLTGTTKRAVTGASWAAGTLTITLLSHGYVPGDKIKFFDFGSTVIDNLTFTIAAPDADHFTISCADPGALSVADGLVSKGSLTWSGFAHLEGKTLDVRADGIGVPQVAVSGGVITLDALAHEIEAGLPFVSRIKVPPPELAPPVGTVQAAAASTYEIWIRVYETEYAKVNGDPVSFRQFDTPVLDLPVPPFTGDRKVEALGWGRIGSGDDDQTIVIECDKPARHQILGVTRKLEVNQG